MQSIDADKLKQMLDECVERVNVPAFIDADPVQFPRRYNALPDIEVAAFLTALISWGRRPMILQNAEKMLAQMGHSPFEYIMDSKLETNSTKAIHRTFQTGDFNYICRGLQAIYRQTDSLQTLFVGKEMFDGIENLRTHIIASNHDAGNRAEKHLSSPARNSACKRIHMFLRWMVRRDGIVDIGCWDQLSPADLYIPLDTHVASVSRQLGMLQRKQNDRKAVELLTHELQKFDPTDPVRYDFALFGIGESAFFNSTEKGKG